MRRIDELVDDIIEEANGHYQFDFSDEPFDGVVIKMDAERCRFYFHWEGRGDEYKFRERLQRMDDWFTTKPYHVQQKWEGYVAKWLRGD